MKKNKIIIIIFLLSITLLSGCLDRDTTTVTFNDVKIETVAANDGLFRTIYSVYFTNGMSKKDIVDDTVLYLDLHRCIDITFYVAEQGGTRYWGVESFKYCE